MRRFLILVVCLASFGLSGPVQSQLQQPAIKVTILGTGVPLHNAFALNAAGRALSGILVEAGSERMLFDCGQGVYNRLLESGGAMMRPNIGLDKVFISHLHSDHIADLSALYSLGAVYRRVDPANSPSTIPLRVWGPEGGPNQPVATWAMMQNFRSAYETDFLIRETYTEEVDPAAIETIDSTTELHQGVVYENNGVKVTAFLVDHGPVEPSYGFRVDYLGRSFVYSGDTTYSDNLVKFSRRVDLLVHEVYGFLRSDGPRFFDYHTSPEMAAQVFFLAKPKQAIYTHMAIPPGTTPKNLVDRTRRAGYFGPLRTARDLMVIEIAEDGAIGITAPPKTAAQDTMRSTSIPAELAAEQGML